MNYLKFGDSENYIVFLHGWGADKNSFLWLKDYFFDYSLVFVDFAGFGESCEPPCPWSVYDYVQDLKVCLDNFRIKSLVLVGHSFGGRVAIKYSYLFQNDYEQFKLCLVDSAGIMPRRGLKYFYKVYKYKLLKKIANRCHFIQKLLYKYGSNDFKKLSPVMKESFKKVVNEDLSYDAKFIIKPTLIIWGRNDKDTKLYMAKKLNKLIISSELKVFRNAGHYSFLDNPNDFLILLDTFIKN